MAEQQLHDVKSILSGSDRDFVVRNDGTQVKVESLKGKKIGLYFSASWCGPCRVFTPQLVKVYNELSSKGDFEFIFVSADGDLESFNKYFNKMPWLAIPFSDSKTREDLDSLFGVSGIPHLVFLDEEGKVMIEDGRSAILEYGADLYPFTAERIRELEEQEEEAKKNQTLKSLLVSSSRDFVIANDGGKVPVSDLVGKTILLSFSAHWCPPCRAFLPTLIEAYTKLKARNEAIEVIFISSDRDQSSFDEYFSQMPWLALPFGDEREAILSRKFEVSGIPKLVAIDPTGKTITTDARKLIMLHGADAYPFTKEHLDQMEPKLVEMAKGWPEKLKHDLHEDHELVLTLRAFYTCDECDKEGRVWSYYCEECDYDLHPQCALNADDKAETKEEGK